MVTSTMVIKLDYYKINDLDAIFSLTNRRVYGYV